MSLRALDAVFRSTLPAVDKVALLALADWANDDGSNIFPSIKTAAAKASLSERTMQRVMHRQTEAGLLSMVTPATPRMPAEYQLHLDRLPGVRGDSVSPPAVAPEAPAGVTATPLGVSGSHPRGVSVTPRGDTATPQGCQGDTQSVSRSVREPSTKKETARRARLPDDFVLTEERRNYAVGKGCTLPTRTFEAFVTFYRGNGKAQLDWDATFRTWVLGAHGGPDWKACGCGGAPADKPRPRVFAAGGVPMLTYEESLARRRAEGRA